MHEFDSVPIRISYPKLPIMIYSLDRSAVYNNAVFLHMLQALMDIFDFQAQVGVSNRLQYGRVKG